MRRLLLPVLCLFVAASANAQRTFDHDILAETFGFDDTTKKEEISSQKEKSHHPMKE